VQQIIDQAKYEVERENMKQGIKRKRSKQSVSPTAKRRRKHTRKVKKTSKNQRVKRLKKTVKKTSSKQSKNKKHNKAKNKSTTLKKTQLIKDSCTGDTSLPVTLSSFSVSCEGSTGILNCRRVPERDPPPICFFPRHMDYDHSSPGFDNNEFISVYLVHIFYPCFRNMGTT
jgi:hypothetical protein